jgi:hypothetical protein
MFEKYHSRLSSLSEAIDIFFDLLDFIKDPEIRISDD